MTSANISGIHSRSNRYYSALLGAFRLSPCRGGELPELCQLIFCLIAHKYAIGVRQLHAFAAALRVPCSVLRDEAVGLQMSILLPQAELVFSLDLWCFWDMHAPRLLAHDRCDDWGAFPSLRLEAETLTLL